MQLLFLCLLMPPAGSYAVKYIYGGPHAADFITMDLCLNLMLTLLGFVPGQLHAVYLLARHKRLRLALAMEMLVLQAMQLLVEAAGLRLSERVADRLQRRGQPHGPQQGQAQGQAQGQGRQQPQSGQEQGQQRHWQGQGLGHGQQQTVRMSTLQRQDADEEPAEEQDGGQQQQAQDQAEAQMHQREPPLVRHRDTDAVEVTGDR
ncbi:hypothetical protein CHLRE_03g196700v5 [Chlamydomonas reinhardtii]|uniref:Uncharacterized protein n=1 Tax=Chlamydomonas reinhardtii TaxID=3055 RepID=A0A2K3DYQ2_CHLRE|nr:uncharacterized protein CHLRE_03g196700v5 [Chlamydomonas reinhardtii]PNW85655.1 hypothetical protein CHLRE_03g196700v5 [Chlamydomonas reinhardtii]